MKITVLPPPWRTWWAYALYGLIFFGLLYSLRRYEMNRILWKNRVKIEQLEAEKLREVDHMKSRFYANISHEFRTPLTLILGPLQTLQSEAADEGAPHSFAMMKRNAHQLLRLINQLLDLSRLEAGGMRLHATPSNIVPVVKGVAYSGHHVQQEAADELVGGEVHDPLGALVLVVLPEEAHAPVC